MSKENRKGVYIRSSVVIIAVTIAFFAILFCLNRVKYTLREHIMDNMQDVSEQNALIVDKKLASIQSLLTGMAGEMQQLSQADAEDILSFLEPYVEVYGLKRIGFIYPDGTSYTTDGFIQNLSFRTFFKQSMKGKSCISDVLTDSLGEQEKINVFSVPVYNQTEDEIAGVLFATYRTNKLWNELRVTSLNGEASSFVVRMDGAILAGSDGNKTDITSNIFDSMQKYQQENEMTINKIKTDMENKQSGRAEIFYDCSYFISYDPIYTPIDDSTWYVLTIAPGEILDERVNVIWVDMEKLVLLLIGILVFVIFGYIISFHGQQKTLEKLAYCDELTGGDNFESFKEKYKAQKEQSGYLISMDIGEFRNINNICGEEAGNAVLKDIWHILLEHVKKNELAAHIGADRYILLLEEENKELLCVRLSKITEQIKEIAEKLNTPRTIPYFGVYNTFRSGTVTGEYSLANQAKALAKQQKAPNYAFFEDVNIEEQLENQQMEDHFQIGIENREFEIWYQPKYNPTDESVVGAEALVRWIQPEGKIISPGRFIPLFEKNGMILELDIYVFETVCKQLHKWKSSGKKLIPISVNVSRSSLYFEGIVDTYKKILNHYELSSDSIQLEITESAAIHNSDIYKLIQEFHRQGFKLLMDDFGSGYSSLASLNELDFDVIKIDKSLIDYIGVSDGEILLYYIIKLAHSLRLKITAEGVEQKTQVDFLRQLECDDIQGFYYSKPLSLQEFEVLL